MTQPPDDLERRPDGGAADEPTAPDEPMADEPPAPEDPTAPENQPTIAWAPPETTSSASDAAPDEPPAAPEPAPEPPEPAPDATGWQPPVAATPTVAWETPGPAVAAPGREGYVIAGMGARIVAYLLDSLIVSIIPTILTIFVTDYSAIIQQVIDASRASAEGQLTRTTFVMEVTPELILVTLISLAIQFIYFVGFWTSDGRATLGMRGLKMQVVDAATGGTLSLTAATKRFIALGAPLGLLILVPALQSAAGIAQFALSLFLFFTAITNDRRQGLHDKWANSLVIRSTTSGDGATLVGCLLLIVLVVGLAIIVSAVLLAALGPQLQDLMQEMENTI